MIPISSIPNINSKAANAADAVDAPHLLVVGKETASLDLLAAVARANAWHMCTAESGWDALERVQSGVRPDLVLLDLGRENGDGLHTLRWLRRVRPDLPVLVMAYSHDILQKTEAIRLGAQEYLVRPLIELQLEDAIKRHLPSASQENDFENTPEEVEEIGEGRIFIAASPAMHRLRAQADLLAQLDVPLLIVGEGGSGKETLARLIHKLSVRSGFRFSKVNCATLGADLLENELFGSLIAGQRRTRSGKLELCQQGTILLDKINEMPGNVQSRLLRMLEEKRVVGVGESTVKLDVRIIATSNANVEASLANYTLGQDLYYHLSAFTMHISPLRQRRGEISLLLGHFMNQLARHYGLEPTAFSPILLEACEQYSWPGNLKQLESFVKRYLVTRDEEAAMGELQNGVRFAPHALPGYCEDASLRENEVNESADRNPGLKSLVQNVKGEAERNAILTALDQTHWNRRAAARLLQVSYRTLLYKIQQYNMAPVRFISPMVGSNGTKGDGHGH